MKQHPEGLEKGLDLSRYSYLLLCGEDKVAGFAIEDDEFDNITLLKWSKPVAWFSRVVSEDVLKIFVELVKSCDRKNVGPECRRYFR